MDSGPLPCCSNKKYHNMFGAIATGGVVCGSVKGGLHNERNDSGAH